MVERKTSEKNILKFYERTSFQIVISVLLAFVAWMLVSFQINTTRDRTIKGVKVALSANASSYQNLGLDIVDKSDRYVDITVSGNINVIATLNTSSFNVTPVFSSVKGAGTYDIPLNVSINNSAGGVEVTEISATSISVTFDSSVTKKVPVTIDLSGHAAADGYIIGNIAASPSEITLTGPENEISKIGSAVAVCSVSGNLTETVKQSVPISLVNESGNVITSATVRMDTEEVDITIPVLKKGVIDLDIGFSNIPEGFDIGILEYVLSKSSLQIAGPASAVDNMSMRTIGYVDLGRFKLGESYVFDVELPNGMENLDNIDSVAVTFLKKDLAEKKLNISDIRVENIPANYEIKVNNKSIAGVNLIGPAADVEVLSAGSVVAVINMDDFSVESGTYTLPVHFTVTSNKTCWATGSYMVTVDVEHRQS